MESKEPTNVNSEIIVETEDVKKVMSEPPSMENVTIENNSQYIRDELEPWIATQIEAGVLYEGKRSSPRVNV